MAGTDTQLAVIVSTRERKGFSTRIMLGHYFADVVSSRDSAIVHWVIQRVGSPEILRLGQENSFPHALEQAHECLESLLVRSTEVPRAALYEFGEGKF
jgi:hypothetical protein